MRPTRYLAAPAELGRPLKMVHPARSSNRRAQQTKTRSKINPKWSIQHAWPVKDAMARTDVAIEAQRHQNRCTPPRDGTPELFRGHPLLAYLASVHVPVSSTTTQTPLEFLGTTQRHSNHAFLPYRTQDSSASARAHTPSHRLLTRDFGTVPVNGSPTESLSLAARPGVGTGR